MARKSKRSSGKSKLTKFERSQEAHLRLNYKAQIEGRGRLYGNYHADVYDQQKKEGRIIPRSERKKIFDYWFKESRPWFRD